MRRSNAQRLKEAARVPWSEGRRHEALPPRQGCECMSSASESVDLPICNGTSGRMADHRVLT